MASEGDLIAGKYRLERFLGSGGFASVWAARNEVIDRPLALKILADTNARKTDIVQRFLREAKIACRPIHPAVLRVEDVGQTAGGTPFLVMELLEGRPLSRELKRHKALPLPVVVALMRHVLEGLAAVHDNGIIHRDIKPSNIFLLNPGAHPPPVRILDLGVAKDLGEDDQLTTTGQLIGTPSYLAPEILLGGDGATWTAGVDVFACGMVLFVSLTARLPFDEDKKQPSHVRVAERILFYRKAQALNRASTFAKKLPPAVDDVIAKALAIDPADRFGSAREMLAALDAASDGISAADPSVFGIDPDVPYVDEAATSILAPVDDAPTTVTPPSVPSVPMIEPMPVVMVDPTPVGDEGSRPSPPPGSESTPPPASPSASAPPVAPAALEDESSSQSGAPSSPTPAAGAEASTPMGWATEPSEVSELSIRPGWGRFVLAVLGLVAIGVAVGTLVVFWPAGSESPESAAPGGAAGAPASPTPATPVTPPAKALDAAVPSMAAEGDATAAAPDAPTMAKVRLVGLPPRARVTFDGEAVSPEAVEGPDGHTGELTVAAPGFTLHEQALTLSDGMEVDLADALRPLPRPGKRRIGPGKRPTGKRGASHIEGRRPGSKIKVISRP